MKDEVFWAYDGTEVQYEKLGWYYPDDFNINVLRHKDGPAVEVVEIHGKNGLIHRDNEPAVIYADGTQMYFCHGLLHRIGGPAIVYGDGAKEWYKDGVPQFNIEQSL